MTTNNNFAPSRHNFVDSDSSGDTYPDDVHKGIDETIRLHCRIIHNPAPGPLWQGIVSLDTLRGGNHGEFSEVVQVLYPDHNTLLIETTPRDLLRAVWEASWRDELSPLEGCQGPLWDACLEAHRLAPEMYESLERLGQSRQEGHDAEEEFLESLDGASDTNDWWARVGGRAYREEQISLEGELVEMGWSLDEL